jgi:peptidoglycan DL-endopeptidase LytE
VTTPPSVTPPKPVVVSGPLTYCIESGDTLFGLAERFHTTVDAILELNPQITDPNLIRIGENLTIPQTE